MSPTISTIDTRTELEKVNDAWQASIKGFELNEAELAAAVADADQAGAKRRDVLAADQFDRSLFLKADAEYKTKGAHVEMLQARRVVLHERGEELERRRNSLFDAARKREIDSAAREIQAAADAANARLVADVKRAWNETPAAVKQFAGTAIISSGEVWIRYYAAYLELRERAALIGVSIAEPYAAGLIGLLVRSGEIS